MVSCPNKTWARLNSSSRTTQIWGPGIVDFTLENSPAGDLDVSWLKNPTSLRVGIFREHIPKVDGQN